MTADWKINRKLMLPILFRRLIIVVCQTLLAIGTYYCGFLLRFDGVLGPEPQAIFLHTLGAVILIKLLCFYWFGLMSGWWKYVGFSDLYDIGRSALAASFLLTISARFMSLHFPRSVIAIDLLLTICALGGARVAVRAHCEMAGRRHLSAIAPATKGTLVIGAGHAGAAIVRELLSNPDLGYAPLGFLDDDPSKRGIKVQGVKVLGLTKDVTRFARTRGATCVLIAMPSASGRRIEQIFEHCRDCQLEVKIIPPLSQRINGSAASRLRPVQVEDLLGREPVYLDQTSIETELRSKVILITGAGGSIGSEISRHVTRFRPAQLLLLDRAESDLFEICTELASCAPSVPCVPVVGDILDVRLLRELFAQYRPDVVFHAAAYKHVPLMEQNCFQAVTNNVFGTYNVALVARQHAAENFVLISTDKAVNPANVMGATKRIGELLALAMRTPQTRFTAVRFGNVLSSNGSVVPIFSQQIARGGPVTVTHPDATRFLMTIAEAAQLVLQAASLESAGAQIFMLKMGTPVRILDIAENMIRLSGLKPGRDIRIVFTGLRPGEKLTEELSRSDEASRPTSHERICALQSRTVSPDVVRAWLTELSVLVESKNMDGLIAKFKEIIPEYSPSPEVVALCELDRHDIAWRHRRESAMLAALPDAA